MPERELSFEQVDALIRKADLAQFKPGGRRHFTASEVARAPADVIPKVCAIYRVVRPILAAILQLPLIPKKWKDSIQTFMRLMDLLCPG